MSSCEPSSNTYSFENSRTPGGRLFSHPNTMKTRAAAEQDLKIFACRLNLDLKGPVGILKPDIERFVINHHLNIDWYQKKLWHASTERFFYFVVSLVLLLTIPVAIAFLPQLVSLVNKPVVVTGAQTTQTALGSTPTLVTTQISGLLTGVFAFYRALSAYFDKRELIGIWARTCAALKQQLYSFEQTWDHRPVDLQNREEFAQALRGASAKAHSLVIEEQRQYFENLSYPNLDLGALLKGSAADSAAVLAPAIAAAKNVSDRHAELTRQMAALELRIVSVTSTVTDQTVRLNAESDPKKQVDILSSLTQSRNQLREAEMNRAVIQRALADQ